MPNVVRRRLINPKPRRVLYHLREQFEVAASAPIGPTRAAAPGPGTVSVVDTENKLSFASGRLQVAGGKTTPAWGDPGLWSTPVAIAPGRALIVNINLSSINSLRIGFSDTSSSFVNPKYLYMLSTSLYATDVVAAIATGVEYQMAMVSRGRVGSMGGFLYAIKGGAFTDWTTLYVDTQVTASTLYPAITNNNSILTGDEWQVCDLGGPWNTSLLYGVAVARLATTAASDTLAGTPDGLAEHTITAATGVTQELIVRRTDDNNCIIVRMDQTAGTIRVYEKNAGVETEKTGGATTQTWTNGTTYRVVVKLNGSAIWTYVNDSRKNVATSTFNQTANGVKVSHAGSNLVVWPLSLDIRPGLVTTPKPTYILPYGDSKTVGTSDTTPPASGQNGYPAYLALLGNFAEYPKRLAVGGRTTATAKAAVDAELAAAVGTPDFILYNLGVNDATFDATWQTNTAYILDAMHVKWPNAVILCMRAWLRTGGFTHSNNLLAALTTVLSTRMPWARLGPNEAVFLENGDNGVAYTSDGTHPNAAGHQLTAAQWKAAIGL